MKRYFAYLPMLILLIVTAVMLWHGPIPQLVRYHDFADQSMWAGGPHAADVLSNVGFAFVAVWGGVGCGSGHSGIVRMCVARGWATNYFWARCC